MKVLVVVTLSLVLAGVPAHSADRMSATPRERAEAFLARVGKGEIAPAYDDLFAASPAVTAKPQAVDALKRQTEAALPIYGKPIGFELQNEKKFGESIVRLTYIQRLEQHPLVWRFWFYRPAEKWYLDGVVFNDQFDHLQCD